MTHPFCNNTVIDERPIDVFGSYHVSEISTDGVITLFDWYNKMASKIDYEQLTIIEYVTAKAKKSFTEVCQLSGKLDHLQEQQEACWRKSEGARRELVRRGILEEGQWLVTGKTRWTK